MLADNISPLVTISSWLGILPFYNRKEKRFCRIVGIPIILTTLCSLVVVGQMYWNYQNRKGVGILYVWIQPLVNWVFYIQTIITVNVNRSGVQKLFDTFDEIDSNLQNTLKAKAPVLKYIPYGIVLLHLLYVIMNIVDYCVDTLEAETWIVLLLFYSGIPWTVYNIHISEFLKVLLIYATLERFRVFNELLELQTEALFVGQKTIDEYIKLHRRCCDLVAIFNDIYGLNTLISLLQMVLYILRVCVALIPQGTGYTAFWFVSMWAAYSVIQGIVLATMCQMVVTEGKKSITLSYNALNRYSNVPVLKEKLFILTQQATARCPQFSAGGFFNVDYAMLFTFVNLITTYVIVIVQFLGDGNGNAAQTTTS